MDNTQELPTVLSICTGYGGIERGLDLAGFEHRVLAYVEIEAYAIANLVAKMEQGKLAPAPIWTNLKTLPAHIFRDRVDVLLGGYPCQPFSVAGKARTTEESFSDPRHLFPYILDHIRTIRPARCFFENVEGHINRGLESVIEDLEGEGYRTTFGIFSASECFAPHQRKRIFLMGDSQHVRSSTPAWGGGIEKASNNDSQGQDKASQSKGASEPKSSSDLQREPVADSRCGTGSESIEPSQLWTTGTRQSSRCTWQESESSTYEEGQTWPVGPGEKQHSWEEPRTVWETKPELAGTVDGLTDRVDRIRLLGNGVVPHTAAKAWTTLNKRLQKESYYG